MPRREFWTDEQVAAYLGMKVDSVRSWCSKHDIKRVHMTPADAVRKAKAAMPGQGSRTDLQYQQIDHENERREEDQGGTLSGR